MKALGVTIAVFMVAACTQSPPAAAVVSPSPSPAAVSPKAEPPPTAMPTHTPIPLPIGAPVARRVLLPATTLPVVGLCTTPIRQYADGNAGPAFCRGGSINVTAWRYFARIDAHVMSVGPRASVDSIRMAIVADFRTHTTIPIEFSGYELARAYYGWKIDFDYWTFVTAGA